jgi:Brp/Blh family beta-carotene 15,15'-monooxygenase
MNLQWPRLYPLVLGASLAVLLLSSLWPESEATWALPFFVLMMLSTGLPHGATDHVIERFRQERRGHQFAWGRFLGVYMGAMLLYGLAWTLLPLLSLGLFIVISAYHFGQSQLLYLAGGEKSPFKAMLYLSWGLAVLTAIIGLHPQASGEVLSVLLPGEQWRALAGWWLPLLGLSASLAMLLLTVAWRQGKLTSRAYALEWLNLGVLLVLSWQCSLLVSFAVYFGLWHSLASISMELRILRQEQPGYGPWDFVRAAWPFSLISFAGIGLLLAGGYLLADYVSPYLLFFMAISVLTLPHMVFMQGFYAVGATPSRHATSAYK